MSLLICKQISPHEHEKVILGSRSSTGLDKTAPQCHPRFPLCSHKVNCRQYTHISTRKHTQTHAYTCIQTRPVVTQSHASSLLKNSFQLVQTLTTLMSGHNKYFKKKKLNCFLQTYPSHNILRSFKL